MLKKIQNATDTGGEKLERFAKVAGMSSEEFSKAFKEDAAQGLHSFVQGLENSSKEGENLTAILSDLGITGIRESDTLLRLAGNSDLLSDSLGMAKTAWEENTALTNEAAQRYETTASKIAVFKNKLKDVGITIGGIVVPILTDLISKAEPLIQAFSNMSAETQTMIVAFAAVAAAIGPVIVVIGSVVSSFGTITTALGGVIASLGAAGGVTGALGAAFAALTGPIGIAIAAFAGIGTATAVVAKELSKSSLEVEDWTNKVSESTAEAVGSFLDLSEQATLSLNQLAWSGATVTQEMATNLIAIYDDMGNQALTAMQEDHAAQLQLMTDHFAQSSALTEQEEAEILANMQTKQAEREQVINDGQARIAEIMNTASAEKRGITEAEQQEINAIQQTMTDNAIEYLTENEREQKVILENLKNEASKITAEQAAEVVKNSKVQKDEVIKEAKEQYDLTVAEIIKQRDEMGTISEEQADKLIEEAQRQRDETVTNAKDMHKNVVSEAKTQAEEHVNQVDWETGEVKSKWKVMTENVKSKMKETGSAIKKDWTDIWNNTKTKVSEIKKSAEDKFAEMKTAVKNKMTEVKTTIETKWNEAKTFLQNIDLKQIGKDVIQGFINGIGSMFGAVQRKISEIANLVPSKIKKILGIASPSKVTTRLGKWTGEGFANGISSQSGNVSKSATKVANEASKAFNNAMQKLDLQLKAGTVSTGSYTKQMNALKSQHKGVTNATQKIDAKVAAANTKQAKEQQKKRQEEMTKLTKRFNTQVQKLDLNLKAGKINTTQYQNSLESMKKEYAKVPNAIAKVDAKIKTQKDKDLKEQFKQDKAYYTAKTKDANVSMQDELNILNTLAKSYKKNSEERVYFENLVKQKKQAIFAEKKKIDEDYLAKVTEVNEKLAESEKKLTEEYRKAVDDRAKSLYSFAGLFDEVSANQEITGDKLLSNLQGQVDMFQKWQASLTQLSGRGISEELLKELQELGPKSAGEIAALNSLTDEQLMQYEALWKEKSALARQQAIAELEGMRLDTAEQIAQLREEAKAQLDVYRNEWETQMKKVTKSATNMAKLMPQTGRDAVQGLIDGMNAKKAELQAVAAEIANIVSSTTARQLDIHSPSRVMKKLGVFTNDGFIEGLKESFSRLKYTVAESYGSLSAVSENAMRQPSTMSGMQTSTYDYSKNPSYVVNVTNASDAQIARIVRREFEAMAFRG